MAPTRASLARSLGRAVRADRLAYTPRLRTVIGESEVQDDLLAALVLHDTRRSSARSTRSSAGRPRRAPG